MDSAPRPAEGRAAERRSARAGPQRAVAASLALVGLAILIAVLRGGGHAPLPLPGTGQAAPPGDPFAYRASRQAQFENRAAAGTAQVLFLKSPGGVVATAPRVARYRPLIDKAAAGSGIDPATLEGIVFLESAGQPNEIVGSDPSAASGLTQILAQTGSSLLGMHIDLAKSRQLTAAIIRAAAAGQPAKVAQLQRQRAKVDDRFDPRRALAATVRYLQLARQRLGRDDLAVVSYHMGIGNLQNVLGRYDRGQPVPYAQVYFDTAPNRHPAAFNLLRGFGDDSFRYYWRVLEAKAIMRMYRSDRAVLARLAKLETAGASTEQVLHPPDQTQFFGDEDALRSAYASRALVPLPSNPGRLGLVYDPALGSDGSGPAALYRGLRPAALDLLVVLAARVRALSGDRRPLILTGAIRKRDSGYSFELSRRYASRGQASALQAMLDRLQALNVIGWVRLPSVIRVTVASDASSVIVDGP